MSPGFHVLSNQGSSDPYNSLSPVGLLPLPIELWMLALGEPNQEPLHQHPLVDAFRLSHGGQEACRGAGHGNRLLRYLLVVSGATQPAFAFPFPLAPLAFSELL